jgi:hypothetical protein
MYLVCTCNRCGGTESAFLYAPVYRSSGCSELWRSNAIKLDREGAGFRFQIFMTSPFHQGFRQGRISIASVVLCLQRVCYDRNISKSSVGLTRINAFYLRVAREISSPFNRQIPYHRTRYIELYGTQTFRG